MSGTTDKRILVVGPVPPPFGGIASLIEDIVHSDLARQYSFDVFERSAGFPPQVSGPISRNLFRFRRFARFFRKLRSARYHCVHIHSADPAFLGTTIFMFLARLAGVKVLLHLQGTDWEWFYPNAPLVRRLYTRVGFCFPTKILVLYSLWAEKIRTLCAWADVQVMRNFIPDTDPPHPMEVERTREHLDLDAGDFVVVSVGMVGKRKGSFEILKAVPRVVAEDDSVKFVFVGKEEKTGEMDQLTEIIETEKLHACVRMTGEIKRDAVPLHLAIADAFLLPSFVEGMPIAIIEAFRSGLPVISTRVNAIPDMIEDGVSGLLLNPGAPDEIAEAVLRLRRDDGLRRRLTKEAKRAFEEKFEVSRVIEELRTVYRNI